MKKKINEQLQNIAKEILELDKRATVQELHASARNVYELLTIALYLENNPDIVEEPLVEEPVDAKTHSEEIEIEEPVPVEQPEIQENLAEPLIEKIKDIVAQMPSESQKIDEILEEILPKKKTLINELEDFASQYQQAPTFERKDTQNPESTENETQNRHRVKQEADEAKKPKSLNDKLTKHLQIGLNDRLSLTKHLFGGSADDYNRVISQVTTLNSVQEAHEFINSRVKPDYNWEGKELYVERFILLIEKRFG